MQSVSSDVKKTYWYRLVLSELREKGRYEYGIGGPSRKKTLSETFA